MAGIVINTKFNPFTYLELLAPALLMTEEHRKVEEGLASLKAQASKWRRLANSETDPIAHALYQRFANDLEVLAAALSNRGLTTSSRRDLYDMSARYQSEIVPIEEAHKRREEQIKAQLSASALNPTLIFSRKAQTTSLDDYINDPTLSYELISGLHLTQLVFNLAKALAEKINSTTISDEGDFIKFSTNKGVSTEDVMKVLRGDADANPLLVKMIEDTIDMTGARGWESDALNLVYAAARQGAWGAVGKEDVNYQQDWRAHMEATLAFQASEASKDRAHLTYLQDRGRSQSQRDRYLSTTHATSDGDPIYYDTTKEIFVARGLSGYYMPALTDAEVTILRGELTRAAGILAYGGPLHLAKQQSNKFWDGGYTKIPNTSEGTNATSGIQKRLQNLTDDEKEYIKAEKEALKKLGNAGLSKYHLGYSPGEWDIYLGDYKKQSPEQVSRANARAMLPMMVLDSFHDNTSGGLESGSFDDVSEDDDELLLIYDGSVGDLGTDYSKDDADNFDGISLSDKFWTDLNTRLKELTYEYRNNKGEFVQTHLNKSNIRIYVDLDSFSDNHFIIVPIENDPFTKDPNYTKRVRNRHLINSQITNSDDDGNSNAGL